jgi:uncharacterized protein YgfB (UPF0149 family)
LACSLDDDDDDDEEEQEEEEEEEEEAFRLTILSIFGSCKKSV